MTKRLDDKTALITGGTSGIGLATALRLLDEGARVTVSGRSESGLKEAERVLEGRATVIRSDAADAGQVKDLVETVARDGDGIDVLFLNAGVATAAPLTETDDETFDRLVNVNFRGPWLALRAAVPHLKPGASVVINTSVSNVKGIPGFGIYAATKAAVRSLVRTAAAELSGMGIRVNAVSPGPVETPIFGKVGLTEAQVDEFQEGIATQVPLGRMGKASEIAGAVAFLASDDAAYVQGAELAVDGGMTQA